jgi:hypothetical protein
MRTRSDQEEATQLSRETETPDIASIDVDPESSRVQSRENSSAEQLHDPFLRDVAWLFERELPRNLFSFLSPASGFSAGEPQRRCRSVGLRRASLYPRRDVSFFFVAETH